MNIGASDRVLLFLDIPIQEMARRCMREKNVSESYTVNSGTDRVGQMFLRRWSDYPVVRVAVAPGCAYVAPTETLLHDGSSYHAGTPSIAWSVLGRIDPAPGREAFVHGADLLPTLQGPTRPIRS